MHTHFIYICIYIYIYREIERPRKREQPKLTYHPRQTKATSMATQGAPIWSKGCDADGAVI